MSEGMRDDVGVVVIGRNEGRRLERCLKSTLAQCPRVVYVDSGSTDDSVELARDLEVEVVQLDPTLPFTAARARNQGIERLRERWPQVRFAQVVDGDCELMPNWIAHARALLEREVRLAVVCGRRWERFPRFTIFNRLCDMEWDTPIGEADACGGDALIRLEAFERAGGYNPMVIAGEEPELCLRLRRGGWTIRRVDADMTVHDAQMTRLRQWIRRVMRCGSAYAEGRRLHGRSPDRFRVGEVRSAALWGGIVPIAAIAPAWWTAGLSLLLWPLAWSALFLKVRRDQRLRGRSRGDATLYARYCVVGKLFQFLGVLQHAAHRMLGRRPTIIEYKGPPAGDAPAPRAAAGTSGSSRGRARILYVGGTLPTRSETFVYRELLLLREMGVDIAVASVHPPQEDLGDDRLRALAGEAIPVYGPGPGRLLADATAAWRADRAGARHVIRRALGDVLSASDVPLLRRPRLLVQAVAGLALARRVADPSVAHIHAHMAHVQTTIAMYAAMYMGISFSFTGHAVDLFAQRALLDRKLRRAAFVACISRWHRQFYQRIVNRATGELPIVRCGVDIEALQPEGAPSPGPFRIVTVGRCVPKKGFDVLLEALARLVRQGRQVHCRIIGDGPQMSDLRRMRVELGLAGHLDLLGAVDNGDIAGHLRDADLFVLPCRIDAATGDRDGIPVALMEAMASGLCAVAGDLVTVRELVEHDVTGVMVKPDSADALAAGIAALMDDEGRRLRLAVAGRHRLEEEFSLEVNVKRLLGAFESVLGAGLAASPPAPLPMEETAATSEAA